MKMTIIPSLSPSAHSLLPTSARRPSIRRWHVLLRFNVLCLPRLLQASYEAQLARFVVV